MNKIKEIEVNAGDLKEGDIFPYTSPLTEDLHIFITNIPEGKAGFLTFYFENPTDEEVEDVRSGKILLGTFSSCDLLVLLFKVGNMPWFDVHTFKSDEIIKGTLNVLLVDSTTNTIVVNREIAISKEFSNKYLQELNKPIPEYLKYLNPDNEHFERVYDYQKYSPEYLAEKTEVFAL